MAESLNILLNDLAQWSALELTRTQKTTLKDSLIPLPGDASSRRYYRLISQSGKSYIVANAPPENEKNESFMAIAQDWLSQGVRTPVIFAADLKQGFLLLEDFGHDTLLDLLQKKSTEVHAYYKSAIDILHRIQTLKPPVKFQLPSFDATFMQREMHLFRQWIISALLKIQPTPELDEIINKTFTTIIEYILTQPYVIMHRDFHSRNLMPLPGRHLGVLDFQDSVKGPATYDIVSLLRDCYIDWPQTQVYQWLNQFAGQTPALHSITVNQLHQYFDWTGLQRHLKVAGIFIRQWLQNKNTFYLNDIPRVFSYIRFVCARYPELTPLNKLIEDTIMPELVQQTWWKHHQLTD